MKEVWTPKDRRAEGRVVAVRIAGQGYDITIICAYFPNDYRKNREKYDPMCRLIGQKASTMAARTAVVMMMDANAHVGYRQGTVGREMQDDEGVGPEEAEKTDPFLT